MGSQTAVEDPRPTRKIRSYSAISAVTHPTYTAALDRLTPPLAPGPVLGLQPIENTGGDEAGHISAQARHLTHERR